jgi:uncharacterized membrane protein
MNTRKSKPASSDVTQGMTRRSLYLYLTAAFLSLVGLADSIYLTVERVAGHAICSTAGCNDVLGSPYASIVGVPLSALGALAYFTVFSLVILAAFGNEIARTLLFYLVALMLAFSIWLFIAQAFVIHKFCPFCLLSGAVTLLLATIVALDRFYLARAPRRKIR